MITHPDKGSDVTMVDVRPSGRRPARQQGQHVGRVQGDELVINGQCSAWVSTAPSHRLHWVTSAPNTKTASSIGRQSVRDGRDHSAGPARRFERQAARQDRQRALPQGEIYFDNVRVPKRFAIALKDEYYGNMTSSWSTPGRTWASCSQASHGGVRDGLQYCHEREQGGKALIDHQLTRYRLGDMLRRSNSAAPWRDARCPTRGCRR